MIKNLIPNSLILVNIFSFFLSFLCSPCGSIASINESNLSHIKSSIKSLQIPFVANKGQMDKRVAFSAKTLDGLMFVTQKGELVYSFSGTNETTGNDSHHIIREQLIEGQVRSVDGLYPSKAQVNFFRGNDPDKWITNAETYMQVSLGNVYDGIDLQLKAYGNNVEKLFYVSPGTTPDDIRVKITGADSLNINNFGQLVLTTDSESVIFTKPVAWQEIDGFKVPVDVEYKLLASNGKQNGYTFAIGSYNPTSTLIIDPLLASSVFGNTGVDIAHGIGVDSEGNVYITGETGAASFPVDMYDTSYNGGVSDVFVSKLSPDLTTLLASTYLGGANTDVAYSLAIDEADFIYITGATASLDYPVNINDTTFNNPGHDFTEVFVSKLSSDLSTLTASTFIGGANSDEGFALTIASESLYITGYTDSFDFPTTEYVYDTIYNTQGDIFITKLPMSLATLTASTFLGGVLNDYGHSITTDSVGNVFITGSSNSSDFPSTTGLNLVQGNGRQVIVAKLSSDLSTLTAASGIGGSGITDIGRGIAIDSTDEIVITGETNSLDFPTTEGAYDRVSSSFEVFVTRFNNDLDTILASTFLGGGSWDYGKALVIDEADNIYVTGSTGTTDFPTTPLAYDTVHNVWDDVFLTKLNDDLSSVLASTFLGSNGNDWGKALTFDNVGNIYVTGTTSANSQSHPFPVTPGSYNFGSRNDKDVFISRLDANLAGPSIQFNAASYSVNESDSSATITLIRFGGSTGEASVNYATSDGSATVNSDYFEASGTIVWSDGDSEDKTFTVPIRQDTDVEGGESVVLTLTSPTGVPLGSPSSATLNIIDDEDPGSLQFTSGSFSIAEDGTTATITVSRTQGSDGGVTVEYATSDGSAIASTDYTTATGTLSWTDGDVADKSFTVTISNNSDLEGDRFLNLTLNNATGSSSIGAPSTAVLTIVDDEDAGSLQFSLESFSVAEDAGQVLVTVTRKGGDTGAVSVEYFTLDDTALDSSDYTEKTGTLSWEDGDSESKTFLVTILDDTDIESEEKVTLTLHNQTGAVSLGVPNVANIAIADNDTPIDPDTLQFSLSNYSVSEGGINATITVIRENASDHAVSVQYATSDGSATAGADYTENSGTLNWNGIDSAPKTFSITITDDDVAEDSETISLTLSTPTGGAIMGTLDTASLTITDNDSASTDHGSFQFNVPMYSAWENAGSFDVAVYRVNGSDGAVSVDFATSDNTAEVGGDYHEISGTLDWADGEGDAKIFTVTLLDDTDWEGDELVDLTLSSPNGGATLGSQSTATLKILENESDNRPGILQFSASEYEVVEAATTVTITVTRTGGDFDWVQLDFATADDTAVVGGDYDEMSGSLEWESGDSTDKTFIIYILDDEEKEGDETVSLTLSNPIGGATLGSRSTATLTILDSEGEGSLAEAILILQVLSSQDVDSISLSADVSGNGKLGIEDVILILKDQVQ